MIPHIKSSHFADHTVIWRYVIRDTESAFNYTRTRLHLWNFAFNLGCVLKVFDLQSPSWLLLYLSLSPTNSQGMYFFIATNSVQMKGAHNRVVPLIAIFHGCSPQTEFSFPGMTPYSFSRLQLQAFQRNLLSHPVVPLLLSTPVVHSYCPFLLSPPIVPSCCPLLLSLPILQMETTFSYDMPQCDELEDSLTPRCSATVHDLRNTNTRTHLDLPSDTTVQCLVLSWPTHWRREY